MHTGVVVVVCIALGCGAKSVKESQAKKLMAVVNETADLLATVKDEASAQAAAPKLKQLMQSDKELQAALLSPTKLSPEEAKDLQDLSAQLDAARARRLTELKRVSAMPGVRDILKVVLVPGAP